MTGAQPPRPGTDDAKIIFLAGAVRFWWDDNWNSPEHKEYRQWRDEVRVALIAGGYLTYAHYEAFKGTWNPRAQAVNDFAIKESDLFLILTPEEIPSPGTDDEIEVARAVGVPILRLSSSVGLARVLHLVEEAIENTPVCGSQEWHYDDESIVVMATCERRLHHEGFHAEHRNGSLWAEWSGRHERAPDDA